HARPRRTTQRQKIRDLPGQRCTTNHNPPKRTEANGIFDGIDRIWKMLKFRRSEGECASLIVFLWRQPIVTAKLSQDQYADDDHRKGTKHNQPINLSGAVIEKERQY